MNDVTQLILRLHQGEFQLADQLLPLVYDEMRKMAAAKLRHEKPGQTLQATALVHEAYLRLVNVEKLQDWDSRRHFYSAAAEAMRRILIEKARSKSRLKRGGERQCVELDEVEGKSGASPFDLLALDEALRKLAEESPEVAEVVKLRFFAGLNYEEIAAMLGVSAITAKRHWRYARVWLLRQMQESQELPIE